MTSGATETAWRIHNQLVDWTGKVDGKASFMLSLEMVVLAGVVALRIESGFLADLNTQASGLFYVASRLFLALAILLAALAVAPSLNVAGGLKKAAADNYVYFGHLRHWTADDLVSRLDEDPLPALSRQLVAMSKIAWRKHLLLVWSMAFAGLGGLTAALAVITN